MPASKDIPAGYRAIWQKFALSLGSAFADIGYRVAVAHDGELHYLLKELYGVPYNEVRVALQEPPVEHTSENIGPVTGLFFEQLVVAIAVPYVRRFLPVARFQRNQCTDAVVRSIARDPDLYIENANRRAVIEIKAAPKKRDLEYVLELHSQYAEAGVGYFLVGGYVSTNSDLLRKFAGNWACFADCSASNIEHLQCMASLDQVLGNAVRYLTAA